MGTSKEQAAGCWRRAVQWWPLAVRRREDQVYLLLALVIGALAGLAVVAFILLNGRLGARLYSMDGAAWRRLALPRRMGNWSLTSLQQRLVKTGGRLVKHARYYWLLLAEGHLSRRLFASMLRMIAALPLPDG